MKKYMAVVLAVLLVVSLCACGKSAEESKSLYDQGLEIVQLMDQAVRSEDYLTLLSASQPLLEILEGVAQGDYTTPKAVYAVNVSSLPVETDTLPESLATACRQRLLPALVSQINAMEGAETLAAATLCVMSKTFVSPDTVEDTLYLYLYDNASPIAVCFVAGEGGAVYGSGTFLLPSDFPQGSPEEIADYFSAALGVPSVDVTPVNS